MQGHVYDGITPLLTVTLDEECYSLYVRCFSLIASTQLQKAITS